MIEIKLFPLLNSFAENKDIARDIRISQMLPALQKNEKIILNFEGIDSTTQSFIHALISDLIRQYGDEIFDMISFKNCNKTVQKIIEIVADYMLESE